MLRVGGNGYGIRVGGAVPVKRKQKVSSATPKGPLSLPTIGGSGEKGAKEESFQKAVSGGGKTMLRKKILHIGGGRIRVSSRGRYCLWGEQLRRTYPLEEGGRKSSGKRPKSLSQGFY